MIGISEKQNILANEQNDRDFDLGVAGFKFSDLFDAVKLREIAEKFYGEVEKENPVLHNALVKYIEQRGSGYERKVESKILTDSAPYLSEFVARMFGVSREREDAVEWGAYETLIDGAHQPIRVEWTEGNGRTERRG